MPKYTNTREHVVIGDSRIFAFFDQHDKNECDLTFIDHEREECPDAFTPMVAIKMFSGPMAMTRIEFTDADDAEHLAVQLAQAAKQLRAMEATKSHDYAERERHADCANLDTEPAGGDV